MRSTSAYAEQWLPEEWGFGRSQVLDLDHDLSFIRTEFMPNRNVAVTSHIRDETPRLVLTLGLEGQSHYVDEKDEKLVFRQGWVTVSTFTSSVGERQYESSKPVCQLRLSAKKSWLERYLGDTAATQLLKQQGLTILTTRPLTMSSWQLAQELARCQPLPGANKIIMHGNALSILAPQLAELLDSGPQAAQQAAGKDRVLVEAARDILCREFRDPPTVESLARRVGTNELKLKMLFHQHLGTTPYALVLEIRMRTAYQLLESARYPVNVVAQQVGYRHASNFSTAFLKFFGVPPKRVARKGYR